jgi:hypothetical protein
MPCYQPTNFPPGFTATGRTPYRTEAACNQACQEGACCEGTTCTVKPQCQCQGTGKTFKGVGTVCAADTCQFCTANGFPKTGSGVSRCYCYCTVNGGTIPQFVNVTIDWSFSSTRIPYGSSMPEPVPSCTRSGTITATLTRQSTSPYIGCPSYLLVTPEYRIEALFSLALGGGSEVGYVLGFINVCSDTGFGPPFDKIVMGAGLNETFLNALTPGTGLGTGVCFSRFTGSSQSNSSGGQNVCDALPGWRCSSTSQVTINGFQ